MIFLCSSVTLKSTIAFPDTSNNVKNIFVNSHAQIFVESDSQKKMSIVKNIAEAAGGSEAAVR